MYDVVAGCNFKKFIEEVNKKSSEGWILNGGISTCVIPEKFEATTHSGEITGYINGYRIYYTQAITKN